VGDGQVSPKEYWIWLQYALGAGARVDEILAQYGSPEKIYYAGSRDWRLSGVFKADTISRLLKKSPSETYSVIKECEENGWHIITPDDEYYPDGFKNLTNFPLVLYVWGDPEVLKHQVPISIVGTRYASVYGKKIATALAASLSKAGALIISGGAKGIDSCAHIGALNAKGKTVAFLGCGLKSNYLIENLELRKLIAKNGAVVSEYTPQTEPTRFAFPIRNRLISAMSLGTVVIEAGEKSGSLITARLALEQGRDVFAVPGDIVSSNFKGTNRLLREGAKPVFSALDVLEEYVFEFADRLNLENTGELIIDNSVSTDIPKVSYESNTAARKSVKINRTAEKQQNSAQITFESAAKENPQSKPTAPEGLSECAMQIFGFLSDTPISTEEILSKSSFPSSEVLTALTELEFSGAVKVFPGGLFSV